MSASEVLPYNHPVAGIFIGNLLMNHQDAFASALLEEATTAEPIGERVVCNPELIRSLSQEAAYSSSEGPDLDDRRMVCYRGLWWAFTIAKHAMPPDNQPEMVETITGHPLPPDVRLRTLIHETIATKSNFPIITQLAYDCSPFVDSTRQYQSMGHCSVAIGFHLLEIGERAKRYREEYIAKQFEQQQIDATFRSMGDAETLSDFCAIALDLTMDDTFNARPY